MSGERYFSLLKKAGLTGLTPLEEAELKRLGDQLNLREDVFKSVGTQNLGKVVQSGKV